MIVEKTRRRLERTMMIDERKAREIADSREYPRHDSLEESLRRVEQTHGHFTLCQGKSGPHYSGHGELSKDRVLIAMWGGGIKNAASAIAEALKPQPTLAQQALARFKNGCQPTAEQLAALEAAVAGE